MKNASPRRAVGAAALALAAGTALALAAPLSASAHVTFDEGTVDAGSYALLTMKVPNESATAETTRITLHLPEDTPFTSVRYVPVDGWTVELVTTDLPEPVTIGSTELTKAVTSIVWTAEAGAAIGDGELGLFPVSLGRVPDVAEVVLPVDQEYSDGTVVSWSEAEGAEHPAPVLHVLSSGAQPSAQPEPGGSGDGGDQPATEAGDGTAAVQGPDVIARVLGIVALVGAAVAVVLAVAGRSRRRETR